MADNAKKTGEDGSGHMCVNPNTCDVCRKIFLKSLADTRKKDYEGKLGGKKSGRVYFADARTW